MGAPGEGGISLNEYGMANSELLRTSSCSSATSPEPATTTTSGYQLLPCEMVEEDFSRFVVVQFTSEGLHAHVIGQQMATGTGTYMYPTVVTRAQVLDPA